MENKKLILKFSEEETENIFEDKVTFLDNEKLVKTLEKTNIKNEDSSLIIKSMNDTPIYDVIQIKINMSETGVFLANFDKEKFDEKTREELLQKIGELKDNVEPTKETQINKTKKLIEILNAYNPIYVSFKNSGEIKFEKEEFEKIAVKFPLIFLVHPKKERVKKDRKPLEYYLKKIHINIKMPEIKFPLFDYDYLFISLFSLLTSFGVITGIFCIKNKESIAAFILVMAVVLTGVLFYAIYTALYKKCEEKYKGLRYYLIAFIVLGIIVGTIIGSIISKKVIKIKVENLSMKKITWLSILISSVILIVSVPASRLINIIVKKQKESAK